METVELVVYSAVAKRRLTGALADAGFESHSGPIRLAHPFTVVVDAPKRSDVDRIAEIARTVDPSVGRIVRPDTGSRFGSHAVEVGSDPITFRDRYPTAVCLTRNGAARHLRLRHAAGRGDPHTLCGRATDQLQVVPEQAFVTYGLGTCPECAELFTAIGDTSAMARLDAHWPGR